MDSWNPKVLNALLSLLLFLGSTSVTVRHDHAQGGTAHGHDLGILPGPVTLRTATSEDGKTSHSHLVLLGIEFYRGVESNFFDSHQFQMDVGGDLDWSTVSSDPQPPANEPIFFAEPALHRLAVRTLSVSRLDICDCARGERSGVRLC